MDEMKNIRIKDIAQMAGVSVGTVDRVIHNRGRISPKARAKVMEVLNRIDYKPNLIARSLGSKKIFRIAIIIPIPDPDPYWGLAHTGIQQAKVEWEQYGIELQPYYFDLHNKKMFQLEMERVLTTPFDGVVMTPIFYHEALPFLQDFEKKKIPFIFFNTNIPNSNPLSFIGQDLFQSGQVAAELMTIGQKQEGDVAIIHVDEDVKDAVHLLEKERGFQTFLKSNQENKLNVISLNLGSPKDEHFKHELETLLSNPNLVGIFVSTSKGTSIIASILEQKKTTRMRVIGYDMLEKNVELLKSGTIDFLINQNPKHQAFLSVSHIVNHLLFHKSVPTLNLFPLEIITRQNVDSYLGSHIH